MTSLYKGNTKAAKKRRVKSRAGRTIDGNNGTLIVSNIPDGVMLSVSGWHHEIPAHTCLCLNEDSMRKLVKRINDILISKF